MKKLKINGTLIFLILGLLGLSGIIVWLFGTCIAIYDRDLFLWITMSGDTVQLKPSTEKNYFIYSHNGEIEFRGEPLYPVYVSIRKDIEQKPFRKTVKTIIIKSGNKYSISANLEPGEYEIFSSLDLKHSSCKEGKYWGAYGSIIRIREDGKSKTEDRKLIHRLKMKIVYPLDGAVVSKKRPTLRWLPVTGAQYYKIDWSCDKAKCWPHNVRTNNPQYTFEEDLCDNCIYRWNVSAYNKNDEELAYYSQPSFTTSFKKQLK